MFQEFLLSLLGKFNHEDPRTNEVCYCRILNILFCSEFNDCNYDIVRCYSTGIWIDRQTYHVLVVWHDDERIFYSSANEK